MTGGFTEVRKVVKKSDEKDSDGQRSTINDKIYLRFYLYLKLINSTLNTYHPIIEQH